MVELIVIFLFVASPVIVVAPEPTNSTASLLPKVTEPVFTVWFVFGFDGNFTFNSTPFTLPIVDVVFQASVGELLVAVYASDAHFVLPSPIFHFPVSLSNPISPFSKTGLLVVQLLEVSTLFLILVVIV